MSRSPNACKNWAIFSAPGGLGWRLKTWDCREEADGEPPVSDAQKWHNSQASV